MVELPIPVIGRDLSAIILVHVRSHVGWYNLLSHVLPPVCCGSGWLLLVNCVGFCSLVFTEGGVSIIIWWLIVILLVLFIDSGVIRVWWSSGRISGLLVISSVESWDVIHLSVIPGLLVVIVWPISRWRSVLLLDLSGLWEV